MRRHRPRHQFHGQQLGPPPRPQRKTDGPGIGAGQLPRQGLFDDQDRRPHQVKRPPTSSRPRCNACKPSTSISSSTTNSSAMKTPIASFQGRLHGPLWWRPKRPQDPLHRLYRPLRSAFPSVYAQGRGRDRLPFRYHANAADVRHGRFELFKTTSFFDGTVQHPGWLGGYPPLGSKSSSHRPGYEAVCVHGKI